mmetsp:Transcript_40928/g.103098  ORF Transcript_40928/g.103098 Transcript_40928/m.103098 type:complete len:206 (-) Transcript_40928:795-1412(-)
MAIDGKFQSRQLSGGILGTLEFVYERVEVPAEAVVATRDGETELVHDEVRGARVHHGGVDNLDLGQVARHHRVYEARLVVEKVVTVGHDEAIPRRPGGQPRVEQLQCGGHVAQHEHTGVRVARPGGAAVRTEVCLALVVVGGRAVAAGVTVAAVRRDEHQVVRLHVSVDHRGEGTPVRMRQRGVRVPEHRVRVQEGDVATAWCCY